MGFSIKVDYDIEFVNEKIIAGGIFPIAIHQNSLMILMP
jgi:hypothetical protein